MGSRQSQLLNRQQQQLGRRRQHLHFHHLLTKSASIYLQLSSTPFPMNKICRSSTQSYPYPRTHTLVVVPPSRSVVESNAEEKHAKMRPPLNRTIPPIPESKSNDSILTHTLEKHTETHTALEPSTSQILRESSCVKSIEEELVASFTAKELQISSQNIGNDGSLVIENRMAQNLATKTAVIISNRNGRSEDVPRSPLMSVAHSVRSKLTKLGSRFSRADGSQNIRTSTSLSRGFNFQDSGNKETLRRISKISKTCVSH